jgi:hypothetical protein
MKTKAKWKIIVICLLPLVAVCLWFALFEIPKIKYESFAPKYVLWKSGILPCPEAIDAYLFFDSDSSDLVKGVDKEKIKLMFSNLHKKPMTHWQRQVGEGLADVPDYLWIGNTQWIIIFKNNLGYKIVLRKE